MKCPNCSQDGTKVYASTLNRGGNVRTQRRSCASCGTRSTYYIIPKELYEMVRKGLEALSEARSVASLRAAQLQAQMVVSYFEQRRSLPAVRKANR